MTKKKIYFIIALRGDIMKIKDAVKRTIASNIRRARIAANMTQADAASRLGITAQAVSNFERGINGIENSLLLQMCEIYNTNLSHILGEEEEIEKAPTVSDEREILDEVDIGFYNGYKELDEADKEVLRDMVRVMRARRANKNNK